MDIPGTGTGTGGGSGFEAVPDGVGLFPHEHCNLIAETRKWV